MRREWASASEGFSTKNQESTAPMATATRVRASASHGFVAIDACGDDELNDGPVQNVGAVGEVSPARGAFDDGKQQACAESEGGDGCGAEDKPAGGLVSDPKQDGGGGDPLAIGLEPARGGSG